MLRRLSLTLWYVSAWLKALVSYLCLSISFTHSLLCPPRKPYRLATQHDTSRVPGSALPLRSANPILRPESQKSNVHPAQCCYSAMWVVKTMRPGHSSSPLCHCHWPRGCSGEQGDVASNLNIKEAQRRLQRMNIQGGGSERCWAAGYICESAPTLPPRWLACLPATMPAHCIASCSSPRFLSPSQCTPASQPA